MNATHTPGPWETDDHESHWSIMGPNGHIGDVRVYRSPGLELIPEADANAQLISAAPDMLEALSAPTWLVWSNEHRAWWAADEKGYSWSVEGAGRYTLEKAIEIAAERRVKRGLGINPPEMIQPSPEWIAARASAIAKAKGV